MSADLLALLDTDPAAGLRATAALMRERAEAVDGWYSVEAWTTTAPMNLPIERADAAHIASWRPAVALAVADLLDDGATYLEFLAREHPDEPRGDLGKWFLAVARAFLEEA